MKKRAEELISILGLNAQVFLTIWQNWFNLSNNFERALQKKITFKWEPGEPKSSLAPEYQSLICSCSKNEESKQNSVRRGISLGFLD